MSEEPRGLVFPEVS
ncbi:hypothetical protein E2C01_097030 [Portunus trituberculatus]|uniref:Uncharacterized protein n=1 Tax=Portunus trituberculatus TaxID=210409 RepID=A0A5B7K8F7_PORTR|nr:hypothetical protein [Portunus trituberculatus]